MRGVELFSDLGLGVASRLTKSEGDPGDRLDDCRGREEWGHRARG